MIHKTNTFAMAMGSKFGQMVQNIKVIGSKIKQRARGLFGMQRVIFTRETSI
jgi:hypothetical protein